MHRPGTRVFERFICPNEEWRPPRTLKIPVFAQSWGRGVIARECVPPSVLSPSPRIQIPLYPIFPMTSELASVSYRFLSIGFCVCILLQIPLVRTCRRRDTRYALPSIALLNTLTCLGSELSFVNLGSITIVPLRPSHCPFQKKDYSLQNQIPPIITFTIFLT